jgi:hypothetical protein
MPSRLEIYGAIALVVALAIGGNYLYVKHLKAQVAELQTEVANAKSQAEVIQKAQEVTDKTVKAMQARSRKNVQDNQKVETVVESGDTSAVDRLLLERGMLSPSKTGAPAGRSPGNPGNLPAR